MSKLLVDPWLRADDEIVTIVLIVASILSIIWLVRILASKKLNPPLPPGPRSLPLIGNLLSLDPELHVYFASLAKVHGPIARLWLGKKLGTVKAEDRTTLGAEFRQVVNEMVGYLGMPNLSDFYPSLALFDLQGVQKNMKVLAKRLDGIFETMIDQRRKMGSDEFENKDFLQFLLKLKDEGGDSKTSFTLAHLKSLLMVKILNFAS
nr:flavonoid 3'-monooxygenase-like [Tanacetum cinerariifolium]